MVSFSQYLIDFVWVFAFLTVSYFIGHFISKFFFKDRLASSDFYIKSFTGLFIMVSLYAIFKTKAQTILLLIPILGILNFKYLKPLNSASDAPTIKKDFIFLLFAVPVIFSIYLFCLTSFSAEEVKYVAGDFNVYFRMSSRLSRYGIESYNFNIDLSTLNKPTSYHFGDLWLYALVSLFVHSNPTSTLLISFTLVSVIFVGGLRSLCVHIFGEPLFKFKYLILLLFAGLFAGFSFCFPTFILPYADIYTYSIFNWGKIAPLASGLIGLVLFASSQSWRNMMIMALITGFIYINAIPAMFVAIFLLLSFNIYTKGITPKEWFRLLALSASVLAIYVVWLYKMLPILMDSPKNPSEVLLSLDAFGNSLYFKTLFNIFVGGSLQLSTLLPYFLVFIIGWIIVHKKNSIAAIKTADNGAILLFLFFFSGLFCWAISYPMVVDTAQFFHNIIAPAYATGISLMLIYVVVRVKNVALSIVMIVLCFSSAYTSLHNVFYTKTFTASQWQKLQSFLSKDKKFENFINIKSLKNYGDWFSNKTDQYPPLSILVYKWPEYQNFSTCTPFFPIKDSSYLHEKTNDIKSASFTIYYDKAKSKGLSDTVIIKNFLSEFKVRYVTVSKDTTLPLYLKNHALDSLVVEQENLTLYRLEQKN